MNEKFSKIITIIIYRVLISACAYRHIWQYFCSMQYKYITVGLSVPFLIDFQINIWSLKAALPLPEESEVGDSEILSTFNNIRARFSCQVCDINRADIFYLPCRHLGSCSNCHTNEHVCRICQLPVTDKIGLRYG